MAGSTVSAPKLPGRFGMLCVAAICGWIWMIVLAERIFNPSSVPVAEKWWVPIVAAASTVVVALGVRKSPPLGEPWLLMVLWMLTYLVSALSAVVSYLAAFAAVQKNRPFEDVFGTGTSPNWVWTFGLVMLVVGQLYLALLAFMPDHSPQESSFHAG